MQVQNSVWSFYESVSSYIVRLRSCSVTRNLDDTHPRHSRLSMGRTALVKTLPSFFSRPLAFPFSTTGSLCMNSLASGLFLIEHDRFGCFPESLFRPFFILSVILISLNEERLTFNWSRCASREADAKVSFERCSYGYSNAVEQREKCKAQFCKTIELADAVVEALYRQSPSSLRST